MAHTDRRLRVAFVTTEFPPSVDGGAGTYAGNLAEALVARGVRVSVLGPTEAASAPAASMPVVGVARRAAGLVRFWAELRSVFREESRNERFDLIHGNGIAALPLASERHSAALVTTIHHVTRELVTPGLRGMVRRLRDFRGETGIVPFAEAHLIRRSDRVIVVSRSTRQSLAHHYPQAATSSVTIYNGIHRVGPEPSSRDVQLMRERYCADDESLLLSVGRLDHRKGIDILIRAFASLDRSTYAARLVIVGTGPRERYRALARALRCDDGIEFLSDLPSTDLAALYQACDIFVTPSRHEGFGFAALEAMTVGKPVVVTRTGAAADGLIDDRCGAVVAVEDVDGLRRGIERLLTNRHGRGLIGERNRARVEHLTWDATAEATISVYEAAIASASGRQSGILRRAPSA